MADPIPTVTPELEDRGPKKSFWGHLADLRSALIRSVIAIGISLILCLFASPWLVKVLMEPLRHMHMFEKAKPTVTLIVGSTKLGPFEVTREQFPGLPPGNAPHAVYQVGMTQVGKEQTLTAKLLPPAPGNETSLRIRLHNFAPAEAFFIAFHVSLYAALIVAAPLKILDGSGSPLRVFAMVPASGRSRRHGARP